MIDKTAILNAVQVLNDNGILGLPYIDGRFHLNTKIFISRYPFGIVEFVNRNDEKYPYEARVEDECGLIFFTILTEDEYQRYRRGETFQESKGGF